LPSAPRRDRDVAGRKAPETPGPMSGEHRAADPTGAAMMDPDGAVTVLPLATSAARLLPPPTSAMRSDLGLDQHADRAKRGRDVVIALGTADGLKEQRQPRARTVRVD